MKEEYKENFIRAGALAREARIYGKSLIKPGASYNEVIAKINQKILDLGAIPAFPPQMALNEVAAHFLTWPNKDIQLKDELIKLDLGVCYNGAIGDCAVTIDLSGKYQMLIDAAEAALLAVEQIIKVGLPIREIGKIIDKTISGYGLTPIRNLSGHGLGSYQVHTSPSIPNYDDRSKGEITPGMTFAVEPFATNGKGLIYEAGKATIFSFQKERPVKSELARNLINKIKTFQGLPFAIHDLLSEERPLMALELGIEELVAAKVIAGYPPLIEQAQGMVAQAENSILVDNRGKVFVTTR